MPGEGAAPPATAAQEYPAPVQPVVETRGGNQRDVEAGRPQVAPWADEGDAHDRQRGHRLPRQWGRGLMSWVQSRGPGGRGRQGQRMIQMDNGKFEIRRATVEDDDAVLGLLCASLGWEDDERHRALFRWKHRDNPFGPSPAWVAEDGEGLVGTRTLMRWGFVKGNDRLSAVRAVDTATHPRAQGRGVFRTLTMRGVEELTADGVDWVFNTPNPASRPGYLSMGWRVVGKLAVSARPALKVAAWPRMLSARHPAQLWSEPTAAGEDAAAVLADTCEITALLESQPASDKVRTDRSAGYLAWRYGACPVGYRALTVKGSAGRGLAVFRLRRRGRALEAAMGEVLVPGADTATAGRLGRYVLAASGADYAVKIGTRPRRWLPLPEAGPILTCRTLAGPPPPPIDQWDLSTGDIELF